MKKSFNVILILGLLSVGFFSCNEVRTQEQAEVQEPTEIQETTEIQEPTDDAYQRHLSEGEGIPETVPQTQQQRQWVNCNECHGTGLEKCYECDGSGQRECSTLRIYSYQCDGCENMAPCPSCNGTGAKKCYNCYGRGNKGNCDNCNGRGQVQI